MTHDESESSMKMNSEKNKNKLTLDTTDLGAGNPLNDTLICGPPDGGPGGAVIDVTQLPQEHALLETCHYFFICHHLIAAARRFLPKPYIRSSFRSSRYQ